MISVIVVDIEGTTSSLAFVRETLFPYSREHLADWIAAHQQSPEVQQALVQARRLAQAPQAGTGELVTRLREWIDRDVKAAPLKTLQGMMWQEAFRSGELSAHLYPDVRPALSDWTVRGARIYSYSSGSVTAQRTWFEHTPEGNLLGYFSGHFDLDSTGPKDAPASYAAIVAAVAVQPGQALFLSDTRAELDAARSAGLHTTGVRRDSAPPVGGGHAEVADFAELAPWGAPARTEGLGG